MSSFTENLYLKRVIQKLQEENQQLLKLLNEVDTNPPMFPGGNPPSPPTIPPSGPHPFPSTEPGPSRPLPTPNPPINPKSVGQRSVTQGGSPPPPNDNPWWDPMYGRGGWGVPMLTPYPVTMPVPMKTPAPMTMPYQQPFSLNRPYDPNDDPNNFRSTKGMGDGGI